MSSLYGGRLADRDPIVELAYVITAPKRMKALNELFPAIAKTGQSHGY